MKGNVNANVRLRKQKQIAVIPFQKDNMWGVALKKGYILYSASDEPNPRSRGYIAVCSPPRPLIYITYTPMLKVYTILFKRKLKTKKVGPHPPPTTKIKKKCLRG